MKTAIMTWYKFNNYGSKLQATAMSEILKKYGCNPYFINYNPRGMPKTDTNLKLKIKDIIKKVKGKTINKTIVNNKFDSYSKKYFNETGLCDSYIDLYQLNDEFDAFVCGSDQIWSPNNFDPRYFLDFAEKEKIIAYAPSIGLNSIENPVIKNKMGKLIERFKYLSVREETGAKIINDLCENKPKVVLDPTLLIDRNTWSEYENKGLNRKLSKEHYIVTYFLGESNKYIKKIVNYAKNKNLKIYNIPVFSYRKINKYNYEEEVGPSEFLSLIKNADCVFTDSFHGTIFSINYNVDFYTFKRFKEKDKINQNSRVIDILNSLSLIDRLIDEKSKINSEKIMYETQNDILKKLRDESSKFLKDALNDILEKKQDNLENTGENITNFCTGCGACASVCPTGALSIEENEEGFQSYKFNKDKCIRCGLCKKVCPMNKLNSKLVKNSEKLYSIKSKDIEVLKKSSSGGVSHIIASKLINEGYYVCGCTYNNNLDIAEHIIIEPYNKDELNKLQGSKYIQSHSFDAIKNIIELGKNHKVLFIGTPCQVAGVDKITRLKKIRDNFILIDLICHGVPSDFLWRKYLKEKVNEYPKLKTNHKIIIRNGLLNKGNRYMTIVMKNNKDKILYSNNQTKDEFYALFNDGTCYNKSCFECPYRVKSSADIRIGDFWGEKFKKDTSGISMVIAMNERGIDIIESIQKKDLAEVELQNINDFFEVQYPFNKSIPLYRESIIKDLKNNHLTLRQIIKKYCKHQNLINRLYKIKRKLKTLKRR